MATITDAANDAYRRLWLGDSDEDKTPGSAYRYAFVTGFSAGVKWAQHYDDDDDE